MKKVRTDRFRWIVIGLMLASVALWAGCEKDDDDDNPPAPTYPMTGDYPDDAANAWIQKCREMVKAGGITPPRASRMYGYLGQTIYEGVVAGMPNHISLYGQINGMPEIPAADPNLEYHWPSVVNGGSARIIDYLFTDASAEVRALATTLQQQLHDEYAATVDAAVLERSETRGMYVASIIQSCADADGYGQNHNCSYDWTAHAGTGLWEPTPPAFSPNPVEPCWGANRPLVIDNIDTQCYPTPPPVYSTDPSSQFYIEMMEVYNIVQANDAEERAIAVFWSDGSGTSTPPGHWENIATQILNAQNANLAQAAEIYCKVGIAVQDAFIACWRVKFDYNYIRPVTAINDLIPGAESWLPPITTPPFPECTSGHSTQSGAAYVVLEDFFGDVAFTDTTNSANVPARSFAGDGSMSSFEKAAWEAAYSRIYGGIHFRTACETGVTQGECIGEMVKALQFRAQS